MKKVWIYNRKGRKGHTVAWYENGKQHTKSLPTMDLAEHYRSIKYQQLNSDVFLSSIDIPWADACAEFLERYDLRGLAESTKYQARMFLTRFTAKCGPTGTKSITQRMVDRYLIDRQKNELSNYTINKDIERLKTLITWMVKCRYHPGSLVITKLRTQPAKIRALTDDQIAALVASAPHMEWKLRIVFALCTGLRKYDLYNVRTSDVDFKKAWVCVTQKKTAKEYSGPIPDDLIGPLTKYLSSRAGHRNQKPGADKNLFRVTSDKWLDKEFRDFRPAGETIQSLRKTYSTRIESTSISTEMLGHSSKSVTKKFYNDMDYIKWIRVNQLPVKTWLAS